MNIDQGTLATKWVGEAEKKARMMFEIARFWAPVIIFIDEVDSLLGKKGGGSGDKEDKQSAMKTQFLVEMEGLSTGEMDPSKIVTLVGATNYPWNIEEAVVRRLGTRVYIPLPDYDSRLAIWKISTKGVEGLDYEKLTVMSEGYSGSGIKNVCQTAEQYPFKRMMKQTRILKLENKDKKAYLREHQEEIADAIADANMGDYLEALTVVKPTPSNKIEEYQEWAKGYGAGKGG